MDIGLLASIIGCMWSWLSRRNWMVWLQDVCDRVLHSQSHNIHKVMVFEPFAPAALFLRIALTIVSSSGFRSVSTANLMLRAFLCILVRLYSFLPTERWPHSVPKNKTLWTNSPAFTAETEHDSFGRLLQNIILHRYDCVSFWLVTRCFSHIWCLFCIVQGWGFLCGFKLVLGFWLKGASSAYLKHFEQLQKKQAAYRTQ